MRALALIALLLADTATLERCAEILPEIDVAATEAGVDPSVIFALVWHESRCRPIEAQHPRDVTGTGQVSWPTWGRFLAGEGFLEPDLLDARMGTLAIGRALAQLEVEYPEAEPWRRLCLYGGGPEALKYKESCHYSTLILGLAAGLRGSQEVALR